MSLKRKLLMVGAALALPLSTGAVALGLAGPAGAVTKYDNSHDTVACGALVLSKLTVSPALSATGSSPTTIKVSGKMYGCTDGNGALNAKGNPSATDFEGVFSGTMSGATNSILSLSGCSVASGTITVSWLATAGATEALAFPKTSLTVDHFFGGTENPTGVGANGTDNLTTDGYGGFSIGVDALTTGGDGGTCATSATMGAGSGFMGALGTGAASAFYGDTQQDFSMFLENQENNALQTTSTIELANGEAYFGS